MINTIDALIEFGLTRQEALIYESLLTHGNMTGYEVSKITNISRSNVYSSLNSLTEKGATYLIEGESTKYTPVELKEFLQNRIKQLQKSAEVLVKNQPKKIVTEEGYITILGTKNIKNKISLMLQKTKLRLYIMADSKIILDFKEELEKLIKAKKKIVIITNNDVLQEAQDLIIYKTQVEEGQIRLITDSNFVLTGEYSESDHDTCLYSGQSNLVQVLKEALKNKIELLNK